jgi:hypothetical protein
MQRAALQVLDLDTGAEIRGVARLDSETGEIRRYELGADGVPAVEDDGLNLKVIFEVRRFRVVSCLDGSELCRTAPSPFAVLKAMIG